MTHRISILLSLGRLIVLAVCFGALDLSTFASALTAEDSLVNATESSSPLAQLPSDAEDSNESDSSLESLSGDMALHGTLWYPPPFHTQAPAAAIAVWESIPQSRIHKPPELA